MAERNRADSDSERITFRLPVTLLRRIEEQNRNVSEFTRTAVELYLRSLSQGLDQSLALSPVIVQVIQNGEVISTGTLTPAPPHTPANIGKK